MGHRAVRRTPGFPPPSCGEDPLSLGVEHWWKCVLDLGFSCCFLSWMLKIVGLKISIYCKNRGTWIPKEAHGTRPNV